jgi:hypothetical protein
LIDFFVPDWNEDVGEPRWFESPQPNENCRAVLERGAK